MQIFEIPRVDLYQIPLYIFPVKMFSYSKRLLAIMYNTYIYIYRIYKDNIKNTPLCTHLECKLFLHTEQYYNINITISQMIGVYCMV